MRFFHSIRWQLQFWNGLLLGLVLTGLGFGDSNFKFHHVITGRSEKLKNDKLIDEKFINGLKDIEIKDKSQVICLAAFSNLFIGWNGDIHICCNDILT